jgi:tetratricopeptide (TPR) repeat protein
MIGGTMDRETILTPAECDLKRLPLGALEAFVLSQVDGRMTLEEIAAIAGLDFGTARALAERLERLGALFAADPKNRRRSTTSKAPPRAKSQASMRPVRIDPRAEKQSLRPARPNSRSDSRSEKPAVAPRRASRRSLRMPRVEAAVKKATVDSEACDLDAATCAAIDALDARLAKDDHYALLDIDCAAEKKAVKRAYFAFAAKFHPDRFFGRKLGRLRAPLDRVFQRMTEAHDVLVDPARRAQYDLRLTPNAVRSSLPPRRMSKKMKAALTTPPKQSAPPKQSVSPKPSMRPKRATSGRPPASTPPVVVMPLPPLPVVEHVPISEDSRRRLNAAAQRLGIQRRVELFVQAAEEAMKVDDVISAANNYRLALEVSEDAFIRRKLEEVDELAKTRRRELSLARARAAERDKRWSDAALHYGKANDARPAAPLAERAAHALWMSNGDLDVAIRLGKSAVAMDPNNAAYRVTLAEIYVASDDVEHAAEHVDEALELDRGNARAKELSALVRKKK